MAQFASLLSHRDIKQGGSLLELGCGAGNLSVGFARLGFHVTGIDIAPTAVEWANERARSEHVEIEFLLGSVLDLSEFEAFSFDVVVDSHCLHCIIGLDRVRFLAEARRVLKPKGAIVINTMCQNARTGDLEGFHVESGLVMHGDIATRSIGTSQEITSEILAAGFELRASAVEASAEVADDLLVVAVKT